MADQELSTAPVQALTDGGFIVTVTAAATPTPKRLAVADVAAGVYAAASALQPEDVGTAAYEPATAYVRTADYDAAIAARDEIIADLLARLTAVESLIGGGGGSGTPLGTQNLLADTDTVNDTQLIGDTDDEDGVTLFGDTAAEPDTYNQYLILLEDI